MTIQEMRELKEQNEREIHVMILKYQEETGLRVTNISSITSAQYGDQPERFVGVKITVEL